ncbi:MAG: radical SAM protein [Candidatus Omnitrophota bacterium]
MRQGSLLSKIIAGKNLAVQIAKQKMRILPPRVPLRIDLNVTNRCNLRCRHCYAALETVKDVPELSLKQIISIIDDAHRHGCRWFRLVGGEPLLRDDIGVIIRHIRKRGMFSEVGTNGLLVAKRINELRAVDALCISLDGDRQSNDLLRGAGSYDKIISGVQAAARNNLKIRLHCVLCAQTLSALPHMVSLSRRYGANINFGEIAGGKNWQEDFRQIDEDRLIAFYRSYADYKKKGAPISNSLFVVDYVMNWPWKDKLTIFRGDKPEPSGGGGHFKIIPCRLGRLYGFIDVDGGMYPCTKLWKQGINYFQHGFDRAWDYLGGLTCVSCREMSSNELSLILSGNLRAILNGIVRFA